VLPISLLLLTVPAYADDATDPSGDGEAEVVVSEERAEAPDPSETSAHVTVLIVDQTVAASDDLAALLDTATGVSVSRLGGLGDWSGVSIRGSSFRQVQVFLDGVPLNPDGADSVNLAELPLQVFERVEVYRGNAPAALGAAPMGGVVNLVTAETLDGGTVRAAVGSHGTWKGGGQLGASRRVGPWQLDGLAFIDAFQTVGDYGYFDDRGTIYNVFDDHMETRANNDKVQLSLLARGRARSGPLTLTVQESLLSREEGLPGSSLAPTLQPRLQTTRALTSATVDWGRAPFSVRALAWNQRRFEVLEDPYGELGLSADLSNRDRFDSTGAQVHGQWVAHPQLLPSLTLRAHRDHFLRTDLTADAVGEPAWRWVGAAVASAELSAWRDRLRVTPVLQGTWLDNRTLADVTSVGSQDDASELVVTHLDPRVGVLVRLAPWLALKANGGRYLRPPDLTELFGDRGALQGNSDLRPETGWAADLGLRAVLSDNPWVAGSVELAGFVSRSQDLIVYVQNSVRTLVPTNFEATDVRGVEIAATLEVAGWVDSRSSVTWTRSENLTDSESVAGNQVPGVPSWELSQDTSAHWGDRVRLGHSWSYTAGTYWDATNWYLSPPRSIHGAFLRVQPTPAWPALAVDVLNLTDAFVEVVPRNPLDETDPNRIVQGVTDFVGYPLPGRTFLFSLTWDV
jgi:vitamin B12 transporter